MRKKGIKRIMALLLTAVLCTGLCTGFTVNAGETDAEVENQTEQAETIQKDDVSSENLPEEADIIETEAQEPETAENTDEGEQKPESPAIERMPEASEEQEEEQNEEEELSEETERKLSDRASSAGLSDPKIEADSGMTAKQKVTWDCVWFGSYPQAEVVPSSEDYTYTALDENLTKNGDIIADSDLYSALEKATGWDDSNEITIAGNRYRRLRREDVTIDGGTPDSPSTPGYYNWFDSPVWHYFKYEPIKWHVLKTDGNQALLLSDVVLDDQQYHEKSGDVTWETSTIRSWMNGYGISSNEQNHSKKNFISSAFTSGEQSAIQNTSVINEDSITHGTDGGNNTVDKLFLLSESEVYGDSAKLYGFVSDSKLYDEARRIRSSTYAKAMGAYTCHGANTTERGFEGNCFWWLRTPGTRSTHTSYVYYNGYVYLDDLDSVDCSIGMRPALNLNLSSNQWCPAGTVCSDGTVEEVDVKIKAESIKLSKTSIELTVGKTETLTAAIQPENASVKTVTWNSENPGIAKVDEYGTITAVSAGKTTVYCKTTDGSATGKCDVLVKEPQNNPDNNPGNTGSNTGNPNTGSNTGGNTGKVTNTTIKVSKITLSGISKKIAAGKKIKLTAKVTPSKAKNKAVTWKSSNTKVATVNSKGVVTLKKNSGGKKVTITATAKDGSKKKAAYKITSMKGVVKKVSISGKKTRTLKAGKTLKLKAKVTASNSGKANKTLKWSSSNTKYATVSSAGKVKTKKAGKRKTVTITAMATDGSNKKAAVKIKLK